MYAFIGGTPAAGKGYLAKQFAEESGLEIAVVSTDDLRKEMAHDPKLEKWVNAYWDKDEKEYWQNATYKTETQLLVDQSEAFFPTIIQKVNETKRNHQHAIFEGVNLLPHLAKKYFDFPGIFLVCEDNKKLLRRLKKDPRWGKTEELQKIEAEKFIEFDARFIKENASKYGYKVFNHPIDANEELKSIFGI